MDYPSPLRPLIFGSLGMLGNWRCRDIVVADANGGRSDRIARGRRAHCCWRGYPSRQASRGTGGKQQWKIHDKIGAEIELSTMVFFPFSPVSDTRSGLNIAPKSRCQGPMASGAKLQGQCRFRLASIAGRQMRRQATLWHDSPNRRPELASVLPNSRPPI